MWTLPCDIPKLCTNACPHKVECPRRRVSLIYHTVNVDRKLHRIYGDIYLNYSVEKLMQDDLTDSVEIPCFNPECDHTIRIPKKDKMDLLLSFEKKYQLTALPVCCKECGQKLFELYGKPSLN